MTAEADIDKLSFGHLMSPPRMVGDSDIELVRRYGGRLPQGACIFEIGPWLGGVTQLLAEYGQVTVLDRFEWTDLNAEAHPGLLTPGDSFRPLFERLMADAGVAVEVLEGDYRDVRWQGGRIDFCYIDAPRSGKNLLSALRLVADDLAPEAYILIKNGLNPAHLDMVCLIEILAGMEVFSVELTEQPQWCNTLVLRPGPHLSALSAFDLTDNKFDTTQPSPAVRDPWGGRFFAAVRLAQRFATKGMKPALEMLRQLPREPDFVYAWDQTEGQLQDDDLDPISRAILAELFSAQISGTGIGAPGKSIAMALRHWWASTAGADWQVDGFDPELIEAAFEHGAYRLPEAAGGLITGKRTLEIGRNLGLSGIGYIGSGASQYRGIELEQLTRGMIKAEGLVPAISYAPLEGVAPSNEPAADLILLRPEAEEDAAVQAFLAGYLKAQEDPPETYAFPPSGAAPRKIRVKQDT